jgi:hypothetical protein
LLSNETYVQRNIVGRSEKEDGSETIAGVQPKKNIKVSAAATAATVQATVQAKTKGRGPKQDGKIPAVIAIHKKSTDVVALPTSLIVSETDVKSNAVNRPRIQKPFNESTTTVSDVYITARITFSQLEVWAHGWQAGNNLLQTGCKEGDVAIGNH